ncbi:hypothetical protein POM88_024205 [Heracleum sosnowskyi]|uniref:Uncharacterized protein n=1 Tax=Heracleum sosnowskyi TaxID=360622 RepID=A0AAD8ML79_9APIA|nr:hypothetical protein POM88_024205 [Heracleum sosnowskyi]
MEVYQIIYLGNDEVQPIDQIGTIKLISGHHVQDILKLEVATEQLEKSIDRDLRLADRLRPDVVERLVQILKNINYRCTQRRAVYILSTVSYDKCREVINKQAVPVLVELMTISFNRLADAVVITLTHLAYASSNCAKVILDNFALETAKEVVKNSTQRHIIHNISLLLAAVCRAKTIFLLISHDETAVVSSALGAVGNIVRRGSLIQIQDDAGLIEPLYKLLEKDELDLDIKMEAAWAIYNIEYK